MNDKKLIQMIKSEDADIVNLGIILLAEKPVDAIREFFVMYGDTPLTQTSDDWGWKFSTLKGILTVYGTRGCYYELGDNHYLISGIGSLNMFNIKGGRGIGDSKMPVIKTKKSNI